MAKMTIGQKAERVLKLLLGLRNPRVAEALYHYGFTAADIEEGWRLLKALTDGRLSARAPQKQDPSQLAALDAWENRWFPIASASLRSRYPAAHDWLFLNLGQTDGAAVIVSVTTLVDRIGRMASEPSLGAEGAQAVALLEQRGLNAGAIQVAKELLARLVSIGEAEPAVQPDPVAQAKAEEMMWNWYLEWGEIARVAVGERRLLREMGFLSGGKRGGGGGIRVSSSISKVSVLSSPPSRPLPSRRGVLGLVEPGWSSRGSRGGQ